MYSISLIIKGEQKNTGTILTTRRRPLAKSLARLAKENEASIIVDVSRVSEPKPVTFIFPD